MAIDLKSLSPKELKALIANAESHMQDARANQIQEVRKKIDALLSSSGLSLADVYPTRGGKGGKRGSVAPKYRNPDDPSQTWTGRGKRPLWFAAAVKRRGVTAESLLIEGAKAKVAPAKRAAKKAVRKKARKR
ncbi:H-NS family nucleoid-associated regulatory protein [Dyella caseinilytica]|uniref:H-NS histone family protein n=1 Tax=Dyella caseinilytica TaxID=1849581 RepID=A0ABX7GXP7_9GAMM|nr:H-NS histone family protein [Dyella caseinilytica]QRN55187.1 H-NS histone family protein [Dyella caseinilytica]GFZ99958.1 DNA-binding protein [Dyella caseinilytica]